MDNATEYTILQLYHCGIETMISLLNQSHDTENHYYGYDYTETQPSLSLYDKKSYEDYAAVYNYTYYDTYVSSGDTQKHSSDTHLSTVRKIEETLNSIVVVVICMFGIVGNVLNLTVLSHKGWNKILGRMERFARSGLIGLAAADLSFCIAVLPHICTNQHQFTYDALNFSILYNAYSSAVINTCILCSILQTVALAVGRYCVIVHPIKAREKFGLTFAKRILVFIILFSIIANLPRFWLQSLREIKCLDGTNGYYISKDGYFKRYETIYLAIYFVIAICIPFVILVYCNIYLVKALRQNRENPVYFQRRTTEQESDSYRLTLCLVIIVLALLILVIPGEIIHFLKDVVLGPNQRNPDVYNLPLAICTCMQALNFSFNFILYCIITKNFRHTLGFIMKCSCDNGDNEGIKRSSFSNSTRFSMINVSPTKTHVPLHNLISSQRRSNDEEYFTSFSL